MIRSDLLCLRDSVRQQVSDGAWKRGLDGLDDLLAQSQVAERDREPDDCYEPLHEHERGHERERPRVAEAVRGAEPQERVRDQRRRPVSRSVSRASSPVSSQVSGTSVAVLTGLARPQGRRS